VAFLALKKYGFSKKKNFTFFQFFSADTMVFSKKLKKKFLTPKK